MPGLPGSLAPNLRSAEDRVQVADATTSVLAHASHGLLLRAGDNLPEGGLQRSCAARPRAGCDGPRPVRGGRAGVSGVTDPQPSRGRPGASGPCHDRDAAVLRGGPHFLPELQRGGEQHGTLQFRRIP